MSERKNQITGKDVQSMVTHWLQTPVNGYLGSDYGQDALALTQLPLADITAADAFLQKLRKDVVILDALPSGSVNLFSVQKAPDQRELIIDIAGTGITVPQKRKE